MESKREDILNNEAMFFDAKVRQEEWKQSKYYNSPDFVRINGKWKELIGCINNKKVLVYGCGNDGSTEWALKKGAYVTAIDISPESIELVKKNAEKLGVAEKLDALVMDALHTTFEEETFDIVFGKAILHHMVDFNGAIKEILRIMKKDGYAVFSEPLGINPIINFYRKLTPDARTAEECPLTEDNLIFLKENTKAEMHFYDCFVLIAKLISAIRLKRFAAICTKILMKVDDKILNKSQKKISFYDKNSWYVILKFFK